MELSSLGPTTGPLLYATNRAPGDTRPGILILAPILFPIAMQLGIDPIHLGIIMVVNMEIGLITPPTGLNLFVTSAVTGMPLTRTVRAVSPWLLVMLAFLILVTYVPFISLALPNWLGMN